MQSIGTESDQHSVFQVTLTSSEKASGDSFSSPAGAHPSGRLGEDPVGRPSNLMPLLAGAATGENLARFKVFGNDYPTR